MQIDMGKQTRRLFAALRGQLNFAVGDVLAALLQYGNHINRAASACRHQYHFHWAGRFIPGIAVHQNLVARSRLTDEG